MQKRIIQKLVSISITLALLLGISPIPTLVNAQTPVTVSIDAPTEVNPDSYFTARVNVTEVADFDVCQFDVTYDPSVIEVLNVTDGNLGGAVVPIGWGTIPPGEQGRIRVIGNIPGAPGVNGSGYLAEIHFHVVGSLGNTSNIDFSNGVLGDAQVDPITPVDWEGGMVEIVEPRASIAVTKTATPAQVAEPGGPVAFTVRVENTSPENNVTLTTLTDSIYGDLNGLGNCTLPQPNLVPGNYYECSFSATVSGNAGDSITSTLTATGSDYSQLIEGSDESTVNITDVPPSIAVDESANPTRLEEPGGTVTFIVGVTNSSVESVTLISLVDTPYGDLTDPTNRTISNSTCVAGATIAADGGAYTCSFQTYISGEVGAFYTDTVTATVEDDEGNIAADADDATIEITQFNPWPSTFYLHLPLVTKNHYSSAR